MPGPEVAVKARAPFQPAPITVPMAEISSSDWTMANLCFAGFRIDAVFAAIARQRLRRREVDGVMGYQAATVAPP